MRRECTRGSVHKDKFDQPGDTYHGMVFVTSHDFDRGFLWGSYRRNRATCIDNSTHWLSRLAATVESLRYVYSFGAIPTRVGGKETLDDHLECLDDWRAGV